MFHAHETTPATRCQSNQNLDDLVSLALVNGAFGAKLRASGFAVPCMIRFDSEQNTGTEVISCIYMSNGAHATWIQGLGATNMYKGKARAYTNIALMLQILGQGRTKH